MTLSRPFQLGSGKFQSAALAVDICTDIIQENTTKTSWSDLNKIASKLLTLQLC